MTNEQIRQSIREDRVTVAKNVIESTLQRFLDCPDRHALGLLTHDLSAYRQAWLELTDDER